MPANTESLVEQVRDALQRAPGSTARELASALRSGGTIVTKRDLNPLLYGERGSFEHDGGHVPRWRLVGQSVARPDLPQRIEDVRRKREQLDERQELVVQLADLEPPVHTPVPRAAVQRREWLLRLHPWQRDAMQAWFDHGCRGVVQAVTGTGKTHLGLEAIAQARASGHRCTVLVPSALLQKQWNRRIKQFVPRATIAHVGGTALGNRARADVVIAVVNSASATDLTALGAGMHLLVADEVHRYGGEGWSSALREDYTWRLGLTATLERSADDGVEARLLPHFNRVLFDYGYDRATEEGVVAPFDLVFLGVDLAPELRAEYDELTRRLSQAAKVLLAAGGSPTGLHQQLKRLRALVS